jgi:hypothetical protein
MREERKREREGPLSSSSFGVHYNNNTDSLTSSSSSSRSPVVLMEKSLEIIVYAVCFF